MLIRNKKIEKIILISIITILVLLIKGLTVSSAEGQEFVANTYIDSPANTIEKGKINVLGWIMTNDIQASVKIYVDDIEKQIISETREEREDVLKAVNGYGTREENPLPGINYIIDANEIQEGIHKLTLKVLSRENQIIATHSQTFYYEEYKGKMYIESPSVQGAEITKDNKIWGWAMSNDENASIKVYIDDNEQDVNITRTKREDVIKAIKEYGTAEENPTPGFEYSLNIEKIIDGEHILKIQVVSQDGQVLAESTRKISINKYKAKTYIDNPANNTTIAGNINVNGWVMTNDTEANIKIYIDEIERQIISETREEREDVLKAVNGYGTREENPLPGINYMIDASEIKEGKHKLTVKILSIENQVIATHSQTFYYEEYKGRMNIESPSVQGAEITKDNKIWGWAMSNDENASIKVYIDNEEQEVDITRREREDVIKAVKGYGTEKENLTPGFETCLNIEQIKDGEHILKIQVVSQYGKVLTESTRKIVVNKYIAKTYIDNPANNTTIVGNINVNGWVMTNDTEADIKIYIDEIERKIISETREKREDVIKAVKGYGTREENPLPGINYMIDANEIKEGRHKLTVKVLSRENQIIATYSQTFYFEEYKTKMYIDEPIENQIVKTNLMLKGWVMSEGENSNLKVYIDNVEQEKAEIIRTEREDVLKAIKGYGTEKENPKPGFEINIDTAKLKDGNHKIELKVFLGEKDTSVTDEISIIIKKYNTRIYIEEPSRTVTDSNEIELGGWIMSELPNKEIIVKFDNDIIENVNLTERPDVINAIKNYGGQENNPTPGFNTVIDVSKYNKGIHTLSVQVFSNETQEIIEELKMQINLVNKIQREIITYGYSGANIRGVGGSQLQCYKFGDGPNVFFATFCVHGYEDSWNADGEVLVNIANNFYDRLIADKDLDLAAKWTIYIFPEVNPDGRRLGYTKDGPGRTTLYSKAEKGIDINRSWQTGSTYIRYSSNRNYNGTEGFQAYEAEYLRNFLLEHKSTTGQTVLVDLHGWENQLIGDAEICEYYKQQYTSCATRNYGNYGVQYLISWARLNIGAKVSLVELPMAANWTEVNNMNLINKYIEATLNMLRGV